MSRILVVEDDILIGQALCKLLKTEGFEPEHFTSLKDGRVAYREKTYDAVILDVNFPDGLGFELCREIREEDGVLPILFLTARVDEDTAVKALSLGACDFVRKPFTSRELVLRVRKALKSGPDRVTVGELSVDQGKRKAIWGREEIELTHSEFEVLSLLLEKSGNLVTRDSLVERVSPDGELMDTSLKSYVSRLKTKLAEAGVDNVQIVTVYGKGYRLEKK